MHPVRHLWYRAIGLPLDLQGKEGEWAREVRDFGAQLERRTGLPVHWIDERMSSVLAERTVRGLGLKKSDPRRHAASSATPAPATPQSSAGNDASRTVADKARA